MSRVCDIRGWNYGIIHSMLASLVQLPLTTLVDQPMLQNQTPEKTRQSHMHNIDSLYTRSHRHHH